ncbi:hypothetical protein F5883DRAFT_653011 [Diaporthe sp. PMI_573]|nr:hypothetical protein F5883DRAFT_653011 [Diaporthaceae sp. PMI_573]
MFKYYIKKCRMHLESTIKDVRPSMETLSRRHASFSHLLCAMEEFEADFPAMFGNDFHLIGDWDGLQKFIIDLNVSMLILLEIVDAAIYDALDLLDLDLSLNDVPGRNTILVQPVKEGDRIHRLRRTRLVGEMTSRIQALAAVLRDLASKAAGLQFRVSKQEFQGSTEQSSDSPDSRGQFRYGEELDSVAGQIWMLTILPGSVGDPMNSTSRSTAPKRQPVEESLSYGY